MKKALYSPILFILLAFSSFHIYSQCNLTYYAGIGVANTGTTFATWANFGPGQYFAWPVLNGGSYALSTCGAAINTQITCWDASASSVVLYNDDNGPFCSGTSASMNNYVPNFTNYMYVQVTQSNCAAGGASSINLYLRQNNNLVFTSSNAPMCSGQTRNLTATPANVGSTPGGYGNPGTFSGTGVSGNVFTAPVVAVPTTYTITYTFGYVSQTQTILVNPSCLPAEALSFDGTDDQVTLGAFNINGAAPRTVEFWLKTANTGGFQNPFSSGNPANSQAFNVKVTPTGHLGFMGFNNDNYPSTGTIIADNTYHHVALSYNGTLMSAYIDGNLEWTFPVSLATTGTNNIIGASNDAGFPQYFPGTIDELRVWNVARTQCEINQYKSCEISSSPSLIAYYQFNQGLRGGANPTVTNLTDNSGNGYSGTLSSFALTGSTSNWIAPGAVVTGSVTPANFTPTVTVNSGAICSGNSFTMTPSGATTYTFSSGSAIVSPTTTTSYTVTGSTSGCTNTAVSAVTVNTCTPAAALDFDGSNDQVSIGNAMNAILDPLNKITVEAWVKPSNTTGLGVIVGNYRNASIQMQFLLRRDLDQYAFWVDDGTGFKVVNSLPASVVVGTWQHVAGVWDGSKLMIYVNGVLHATTTGVTGSSFASTANPVVMGFNSINENFTGTIDEIRIWTVNRTPCEINTYKNCEIPTTASGLLANYHFNQGLAALPNPGVTTLTDASGNGYSGTLTNFGLTGATSNWVSPGGVISGSVTPLTLPTSTISASPALCNGGNGTATVTASGGTAAYTYSWSTTATTSVISSVAGVKTVTVTDANACSTTNSITITQPSALSTTTAVTNVSCNGGSTGSATVTASGGTGAYTYLWSTAATTSVITGQTAGVKTVTVTDANSCAATNSITLTQPSSLLASVAVTTVACNGGSTGTATVTASGGTGAYTYLWSTAATTSVITGQAVGIKTATVTDANGCTAVATGTIVQPSALVTSTAVTNVLCNGGSTGSATITASGGTAGYTYLWSTAATSSVITGQLAGVKTVTVTDANGCTSTKSVTITEPLALTTSTAVTNILCNGGSTGSATVTASGGTAGYTYLWSTAATTSVITGQTAGVKTVTVTDANGCTTTNSVSITQPATALSTATAVSHVLCNGNSTGSATITTSGGTAGYTYLWSTAATTSVITGQTSGVKTVTVTDANGCTTTNSVSITQPATALTTATAVSHVLCNAGSTGSATITTSGGTAGYTYLWSTAATTSVITGQTAGVKTVTVTDANGCAATNTVTITQPTALATATAVTNILCNGGSTGSATVTASGGTTSYTYLWSTAATTSVITGQTAGVKTVTVTDANGCTRTNSISITQPATALSTATTVSNVLCNGNSTGSATVTASGGTAGYTYLWSTAATTSVITGQTAGVKTVTVTDANGCTTTNSVSITQPATAISSSTAVTHILCNAGSTGSATVTASGGTAGYTYLWSTAATTSVITGQTAGVKTVTVTDANGCTTTNSVSITQPAAGLSATQTQTNVTCVINGRAAVTVSGGTPAYTYTWSPAGGNAATSTTLSAGSYTCSITDANNCTLASLFSITANTVAPVVAIGGSTAICNGANTSLTASGATTYTWSTGATIPTVNVNPSSTSIYSVTGTNSTNGCTASASHTLTVNPIPTLTATASSTVICTSQSATLTAGGAATYTWSTGSNAASIVVTPTVTSSYTLNGTSAAGCPGNTTITISVVNTPTVTAVSSSSAICAGSSATLTANGATTYSWSTGATSNSIVVTPATNTTYSVNGTVAAGCNSTSMVSLTVNSNPTVSISSSQSSVCPGQTSTLTASGATSYTWSTGSNASSITSTPVVSTGYTVTGSNAAGCTHTASQTIGLFPAAAINMLNIGSPSASVCAGSSATLVASGVSTYTWSTGSNNPAISISPSGTTTYSVNGTDLNGCTASNSITIGISSTPTLSAAAGSAGICQGFSSSLSVSGALTYTWSTGATSASISVSPAASTVYTVSGTNGAGCISTTTLSLLVYASPTVNIGADAQVPAGTSYQFNPVQTGATSYTWSPVTYLSATNILNPSTSPESDITYILTVGSANGCTASDTVIIKVLNDLVMANYMSPNGDGQNDTWKVSTPALIKDYSVTIIDSYGKTVFSVGNNYNNEFDGKLGGQELPDGVYYYFIKDGNDTRFKGSITLTK